MGELLRDKQIAETPHTELAFAFGTVSPVDFGLLSTGDVITDANIVIETPFNDAAAALTLGLTTAPGGILPASAVDPTVAGTYNNSESFPIAAPNTLRLVITPGASTAGAGRVLVSVRKKTR